MCGHSERRSLFGDKDSIINKKVLKVLGQGLKVQCIVVYPTIPYFYLYSTASFFHTPLLHSLCYASVRRKMNTRRV